MARINLYETTKEISKNMKGLSGKLDELKSDMDQYFHLLNEAKIKAEQKARELEDKRKQEEIIADTKNKEEESRLEIERLAKLQQQEKEQLENEEKEKQIEEQRKKDKQEKEQLEKKEKEKQIKEQRKREQQERDKRKEQEQNKPVMDPKQPTDKSAASASKQQTRTERPGKPASAEQSAGTKKDRKSHSANKQQQTYRGDIIDKFLSQPPVADKEKADSSKGSAPRYGDQSRDRNRRGKKDYWQDRNIDMLQKKPRRTKKDKKAKPAAPPPERKKAITMGDFITVKELSEKIGIQVSEIIKKLLGLGVLATINQELDYDTANLIASEFNIELERKAVKSYEEQLEDVDIEDEEKDLTERPPVVTVMGHVDHGKTSLLDAIRNARVTDAEAGGITQHIGAYTVNVNDKSITFLDTPGHEAFTSMRARGAQVTDIAILVVAADDGVMPQTIEAINHAKAAEVPIIVAINKMDKPTSNPERIKQELTEHGLLVEEWGGDTIAVPVSALKKEGIDDILEMILLVAEVQDLKANPKRFAKGTIVEAELDKGRGPVATILVQNGTLRIGDSIVAGTTYGRVRAMIDDKGRRIEDAGPSIPVEVLGLNEVPAAGDIMYAVEDDKLAKQVSEERRDKVKAQQVNITARTSLDELFSQLKEGEVKDLNIIIKADVHGSVEAIKQALEKLSNEQVRIRIIHGGVGAITESDVLLASASNAIITGFNVRPSINAVDLAEREEIDIRTYRVIYNAIEDIEAAMKGLLDPEFKEVVIGHASVRTTFKVSGIGTIAGSYVSDGKITRSAGARVVRDGIVIYEGNIDSLRRFKDDVREVASNYECGIGLENFNDIKEEDVIEAFIMEEIKR